MDCRKESGIDPPNELKDTLNCTLKPLVGGSERNRLSGMLPVRELSLKSTVAKEV